MRHLSCCCCVSGDGGDWLTGDCVGGYEGKLGGEREWVREWDWDVLMEGFGVGRIAGLDEVLVWEVA